MDYFKIWALSLSGALVVASVFRILIKNSNVYKSINIFLSVFIFLYTIIPLEDVFDNFKINTSIEYEDVSYDEYYQDGYENIIKCAIENLCNENNVSVISINIDSYIDEEGYLCINYLEIETDSPEQKNNIKEKIKEKFGFEVNNIE